MAKKAKNGPGRPPGPKKKAVNLYLSEHTIRIMRSEAAQANRNLSYIVEQKFEK